MPTLSEILVKKDYTQKQPSQFFYKDSPFWQKLLTLAFVGLLTCSALGESKTIMLSLGALPKGITVGIICLAIGYGFIYPDSKRIQTILRPTLIFMLLMASLLLWSMVIWILNFAAKASMIRACSKIAFQSISILTAVSAVYLFGARAIDLFAIGACLANAGIMILEVPAYGIGPSIQSLITCIVTFGDAVGYARQLEIHDLTFMFGQLILYYAVFAPHKTAKENRRRWLLLLSCSFFFFIGMKRIAIPAVILFIFIGLFFRKRKNLRPFLLLWGIAWIVFFLFYLYIVHSGIFSQLLNAFGIDMMGRDHFWMMANDYYDLSPFYMGKGFEYVDTIVTNWYHAGLINHPYPFHNDILKVFVELGCPGFFLWSGIQYVLYPLFWLHYSDEQTALLYMCVLSYMTMTYLTDNTAFYFWSTMALRLLPLCYSIERKKKPKPEVWKPRDKKEMHEHIRVLMQETQE